ARFEERADDTMTISDLRKRSFGPEPPPEHSKPSFGSIRIALAGLQFGAFPPCWAAGRLLGRPCAATRITLCACDDVVVPQRRLRRHDDSAGERTVIARCKCTEKERCPLASR